MSILVEILSNKKDELRESKRQLSFDDLKEKTLKDSPCIKHKKTFIESIKSTKFPSIIAEVKKASPSKGIIRADLNPLQTALDYQSAGASAISVLTDQKYFKGDLDYLKEISASVNLPTLRKDFIIDEYQIYEAKLVGASAILLIAAALTQEELANLYLKSTELELSTLIEIHNEPELRKISPIIKENSKNCLLGINNRNLNTFKTDLNTTKELCQQIKVEFQDTDIGIVSESGIETSDDLSLLKTFGANAFLIGESLVKQGSPLNNLKTLIKQSQDNK